MGNRKLTNKLQPKAENTIAANVVRIVLPVTVVAAIIFAVFSISSTTSSEICGNEIDDDGDGTIDEAGCTCTSGDTAIANYEIATYYAVAQGNVGVDGAEEALGPIGGPFAEIYQDSDVLILKMGREIAAGETYTIEWASRYGPTEMMLSESVDSVNFYYNTTVATSQQDYVRTTIIAQVATRYIRFDKNDFTPVSGMTVFNGVPSNNSTDYKVYAIKSSAKEERYVCYESTETCGNNIDDNGDGEIDESSCDCPSGEFSTPAHLNNNRFASRKTEINITHARFSIGAPDGKMAEIYSDTDVLILELEEVIPEDSTYNIYWASKDADTARMIISESSDYTNFYYNSTPSTAGTSITKTEITAGRNTKFIRFDKNEIDSIAGIHVLNGVSSNSSDDYKVDAVVFRSSTQRYGCGVDSDGDGVFNLTDLDDDNDGIMDIAEEMSFDPNVSSIDSMVFRSPTLESGSALSEGAVYRFSEVLTGVDGLLTVDSLVDISIADIDDNDGGILASLQPELSITSGADSGWAEFTLRFAKTNTTTDTILSFINGAAVDIDGNETAVYEAVSFRDVNYLYTDPHANLSYLTNGTWHTYKGFPDSFSLSGGIDPSLIVAFHKRNASTINFRHMIYQSNSTDSRLFSMYFDPSLVNEITNPVKNEILLSDSDLDGVANLLDLDTDNDGIYDSEESGAGIAHANGIVSGSVTTLGIPSLIDANSDLKMDYFLLNTDGGARGNFDDPDSDNDGCSDVREAGFNDGDNNRQLDGSGVSAKGAIIGFSSGYTSPGTDYINASVSDGCPATLPVEWLDFQAELNNEGKVVLYWATLSEQNSDYYQVERSFDHQAFQSLGNVKAAGNSQNIEEYQYVDAKVNQLNQSTSYYRLKQVDIDGSFDYSKIVEVQLGQMLGKPSLTLFPNPTSHTVNVEINNYTKERTRLTVWSITGQLMKSEEAEQATYTFSVSDWPAGTYIVKVETKRLQLTSRFVKN